LEEAVCQHLDELRLADAGRADEDKGGGPSAGGDLHSGATNRRRNQFAGLILTDHFGFQFRFELAELLEIALLHLARRDTGPELDDDREVVLSHLRGQRNRLEPLVLLLQLNQLGFGFGKRLVIDLLILLKIGDLLLGRADLLPGDLVLREFLVGKGRAGAGFIQQSIALSGKNRSVMYRSERRAQSRRIPSLTLTWWNFS
jgi:hypothetical protein